MSVFLDTGVLAGAFNDDDEYHEEALGIYLAVFSGRWGAIFTSDYIIDETTTHLKVKASPVAAVKFLNRSLASESLSIIRIDEGLFDRAKSFFERYPDKPGLSFTDASTLAVLQSLEIEHLASFDGRSFDGIVKNRIGENFWLELVEEERMKLLREFDEL